MLPRFAIFKHLTVIYSITIRDNLAHRVWSGSLASWAIRKWGWSPTYLNQLKSSPRLKITKWQQWSGGGTQTCWMAAAARQHTPPTANPSGPTSSVSLLTSAWGWCPMVGVVSSAWWRTSCVEVQRKRRRATIGAEFRIFMVRILLPVSGYVQHFLWFNIPPWLSCKDTKVTLSISWAPSLDAEPKGDEAQGK